VLGTRPARVDSSADTEALIREARRRQRRRYAAIGLAATLVLAGALSAAGVLHGAGHPRPPSQPRTRPPARPAARPRPPGPIPASVGTTVLMWPVGYPAFGPAGGPPAYVDNLSTGRLSESQQPAIGACDCQPLLITVGRWLVYVGNGTRAIRDDLKGRPRVLAATSFFAPSAAPGHVWLSDLPHSGRERIRSVAVTGGAPGPVITLPRNDSLVEGTDAGLLIRNGQQRLEIWNPGAAARMLPYSPIWEEGFDATARLVAYGTGCTTRVTAANGVYEQNAGYDICAVLRVFNVVTGRLSSFPAPPGTAGWVPDGFYLVSAIAPGGKTIAAYAATRPQGQGRTRLYLLRVAGSRRRPIAVPSSGAFLYSRTAWSARGAWLLYRGTGTRLWAYQVSTGRVRSSRTPCCQYSVMVAMRAPPRRPAEVPGIPITLRRW
jgi:hypothetical protein